MKNILIIDEENISIRGIKYLIENNIDSKILVAKSCSEAIALFQANDYDLLILDLMLPIGDYEISKDIINGDIDSMFGLQLLKFFRKIDERVRIVGYSIADTEEIKQSFSESNADYICKLSRNNRDKLVNVLLEI